MELNNADMEHTGEGYMYSTREKQGYGWSHPKRPQEMSENSELGLYYSWAYASAGISYAMKTGDDTYIKQSGMTEGDQKLFKSIALLEETREGKYWEESGNFVYRLESDRPEKKGEEYSWPYQLQCFMETSTCVTEKCMKFLRIPMVGGRLSTPLGLLRRGILMVPGRWKGSLKVSLPMLLENPLINSLLFI